MPPQSLHCSNSPSSTRKAFSSERGSAKALLKASAAACVLWEFDCLEYLEWVSCSLSEYVLGVLQSCKDLFKHGWCLELRSLVELWLFSHMFAMILIHHALIPVQASPSNFQMSVHYHTVAGQSMPACGTQSLMPTSRFATELPLLWVYDRPGAMADKAHFQIYTTATGASTVSGPTLEHFREIHQKASDWNKTPVLCLLCNQPRKETGLHCFHRSGTFISSTSISL